MFWQTSSSVRLLNQSNSPFCGRFGCWEFPGLDCFGRHSFYKWVVLWGYWRTRLCFGTFPTFERIFVAKNLVFGRFLDLLLKKGAFLLWFSISKACWGSLRSLFARKKSRFRSIFTSKTFEPPPKWILINLPGYETSKTQGFGHKITKNMHQTPLFKPLTQLFTQVLNSSPLRASLRSQLSKNYD